MKPIKKLSNLELSQLLAMMGQMIEAAKGNNDLIWLMPLPLTKGITKYYSELREEERERKSKV